jgi:hypothetical protein
METQHPRFGLILELLSGGQAASGTPTDYELRALSTMARRFECLKDAPGIDPFDKRAPAKWAAAPVSQRQKNCAHFVLTLCGGGIDTDEALKVWEPEDLAIVNKWSEHPWWVGLGDVALITSPSLW